MRNLLDKGVASIIAADIDQEPGMSSNVYVGGCVQSDVVRFGRLESEYQYECEHGQHVCCTDMIWTVCMH
jgi:hypothetical protein